MSALGFGLNRSNFCSDYISIEQKAIKAFQQDCGLDPDGEVGTLTANRLFTEALSVISFDSDGSTPHFARNEFACDCGGATCDGFPAEMCLELLLKLEALRNALNVPVIITSGLRCPERNAAVGGVPQSQHLFGQAADLYAPGIAITTVAAIAIANEGLSILENLAVLGVPIPRRLKQVLAELGADDPPD